MQKQIYTLVLLAFFINTQSQINPLQEYINEGIENNLVIQQNNLSLKNAQHSLKIAKGMFLPQASIQARYSLAEGGRTIDFPLGDLMNPVYKTLNEMLQAQGQAGGFPSIENESFSLYPSQEFDARVSVVQPIYNRSLIINNKIAQEQLKMTKIEIERYKRELAFQIKEAYFNYLKTIQLLELVNRTKEVVNENYRVSKKLFDNQMATNDVVMRANAEINSVKLMETEITTSNELAKNFFNFLLNRGLDTEILVAKTNTQTISQPINQYMQKALKYREELSLLKSKAQLYSYSANLSSAALTPNLVLAFDYGLQGEEFSSFNDHDFVMGSVVLTWSIFNGNINKNKRQQAYINKRKNSLKQEEISKKIKLEVKNDYLHVAQQNQNLQTAQARNKESVEVYRIIEKRYREGGSSLIELLDARNNMVEAESDMINTQYDFLISLAKLEKSSNSEILKW